MDFAELALLRSIPYGSVVDVGAGTGEYCQAAIRSGHWIMAAFEPDPLNVDIILKKLPMLPLTQAAIFDVQKRMNLYIRTKGKSDLGSSLAQRKFHTAAIQVKAIRLDSVLTSTPDLLKIDVEGFELPVLRSLGSIRPKLIQFEFSCNTWRDAGYNLADAVQHLKDRNYSFDIPDEDNPYINILCRAN